MVNSSGSVPTPKNKRKKGPKVVQPRQFVGNTGKPRKDPSILGTTDAARMLGVTSQFMRTLDTSDRLKPDFLTEKGFRRYKVGSVRRFKIQRNNARGLNLPKNRGDIKYKNAAKNKIWRGAREDGQHFTVPELTELTEDQIAALWVNKGGENTRIPIDHPSEFAIACSLCGLSDRKVALRFGTPHGSLRNMWYYAYSQEAPDALWLELAAIWKRILSGRILMADPLSAAMTSSAVDRMSNMALMVECSDE